MIMIIRRQSISLQANLILLKRNLCHKRRVSGLDSKCLKSQKKIMVSKKQFSPSKNLSFKIILRLILQNHLTSKIEILDRVEERGIQHRPTDLQGKSHQVMILTHVHQYQWIGNRSQALLIKDNSNPSNSPRHILPPRHLLPLKQIYLSSKPQKRGSRSCHSNSVKLMEQVLRQGTRRDMVSTRSLA